MTDNPITREGWRRIEEVLDEALELTPEEVPAFLDRACAGEAELRRQVEELLAADRQAQDFLAPPDAETVASLLSEVETPFLVGPSQDLEGREIGPYRILRRIGAGGMGIVYLARDTRLDRTVAVKLLPADWAGTPAARERFLREARLISALDHPNICTLHDIGETGDGRLYLVMAHYQGETLKARLARGPLAVAEAVEIAVQVGRGLARAHAAGIVHRDIKPANVVVTEHGEAKILDFGIAKSARDAALTRTGSSLGTPGYMSPEQARGAAVDERTDVWSLAVMLYEMIAGRQPFAADHPQAQIHAILERNPEPLDRGRSDVPPAVTRAVGKALVKDPAGRTPSAAAFVAELTAATGPQALAAAAHRRHWRALAAAGLLAAVVVGLGAWSIWRVGGQGRTTSPGVGPQVQAAAAVPVVPVVAILPFVNRTADDALVRCGADVAGLVREYLSTSSNLQVASDQRTEPLAAIPGGAERSGRAAKDGVDYLLSGEILPEPSGGLLLIARLEDTRDRSLQRSAGRAAGPKCTDLMRAADRINVGTRKALDVPWEENVDVFTANFAAENPQAYEEYDAGLRAFAHKRYDEAERAFRRALDKTPNFIMARFRLAHTIAVTGDTERAQVEFRGVLEGAEGLPDRDASYVRAFAAYLKRDYSAAISAYHDITIRYRYEMEPRYFYAALLKSVHRYKEALEQIAVLKQLEPENANVWDLSGETYLAQGSFLQAVDEFKHYLGLAPGAEGNKLLGDAYRAARMYDFAHESYETALRLDPTNDEAKVALAVNDALSGDWEPAKTRLGKVVADANASKRHRLDAVFEKVAILRAEGRFRDAEKELASIHDLLATEGVREPMALAIRGMCLLELGKSAAARPLLETAVKLALDPNRAVKLSPIRYLFARGLLEIQDGRTADFDATVNAIRAAAGPADNPDRTGHSAAFCLMGMHAYFNGRLPMAVDSLTRAVNLDANAYRTEYASYQLWLAKAYLAAGRPDQALAAAREAEEAKVEPAHPLDLALDRVRALLVQAQARSALGKPAEAAPLARQFLVRWQGADHGLKDFAEARRLAGLPPG